MNIDKFISENRDAFNTEKLSENHEQRFEQKLKHHYKAKRSNRVYLICSSVAAAVLLVLVPVFTTKHLQANTNTEFADVKRYYQSELDKEIEQFKPLLSNVDEELRINIEEELEKIKNNTKVPKEMEKIPNEILLSCTASIYSSGIESVKHLHSTINISE